jgi:ubiquinol-cytochrome c reductase cytochrome b subunit
MLALAVVEGFFGYSLPDDLLSGTGVRIAEGIVLSIPVVGTYLTFFAFGGQFPGHSFIPRMYIAHVLLVPGLLVALVTAHLMILWHQGHTQWPGKKERDDNEVGEPLYPIFMAKTGALFFFTFSALAIAATAAQINPIWLFGPYNPVLASINSQPDWYVGFMEGSLRLMPGVDSTFAGHTLVWNVFIPAVLLPLGFFLAAGLYPFLERFATGDRRFHQVLDRPRNEPTRTAIGVAVIAAAVDLLLAGGDDVIAYRLDIPVNDLVWVLRVGFFVLPVVAFFGTRYACLALQRRDRRTLARGMPTGEIRELPSGDFIAVTRPLSEERRARLETRRPQELTAAIPRHLIPLPTPGRVRAQVRSRLNRFYTNYRLETVSKDAGPPDGSSADGSSPNGSSPDGSSSSGIVTLAASIRRLLPGRAGQAHDQGGPPS